MDIKGSIDMSRPTRVHVDAMALLHNLRQIRHAAPGKKVVAMVKANDMNAIRNGSFLAFSISYILR